MIAQAKIEKTQQEIAEAANAELSGGHATQTLDSLLSPLSRHNTKIPENEIRKAGPVPVVTQQQGPLISGYTDHAEVIDDLPLVVFGDHTCVFKYVDFPFVRGADGTQLLKLNEAILNPRYFACIAPHLKITNAGKYERHFKYLKSMRVPVPPLPEQKKFVARIEALEAEIATARATLAAAPARKEAILKKYL